MGKYRLLVTAGLAAVLIAAGVPVTAYALIRHDRSHSRPYGFPAAVPGSQINLMELSPIPVRPAPGFTLTARTAGYCPCPRSAARSWCWSSSTRTAPASARSCRTSSLAPTATVGTRRGKVVSAAVNVNQYHKAVADVAAFSREHQLSSIPGWHFLTGSGSSLRAAWRDYNVAVQAPDPDADIAHFPVVYFIDPRGRERYLASPQADDASSGESDSPPGQIAAWGPGHRADRRRPRHLTSRAERPCNEMRGRQPPPVTARRVHGTSRGMSGCCCHSCHRQLLFLACSLRG